MSISSRHLLRNAGARATTSRRLLILMMMVGLLIAGCTRRAVPDSTFAERVAACEWYCAELTLGMVEQGLYAEAVQPLATAWQHADERERADVPHYEPDWRNHVFRLHVAQAVIARHLESADTATPLNQLWQRSATLFGVVSFESLAGVDLRFLRKTDRLWLLKALAETPALGQETRELLTLVLRANSRMSVDRLVLGKEQQPAT